MIRIILPATVSIFLAPLADAEGTGVLEIHAQKQMDMAACVTTGDSGSCVRILACVGSGGLWIDGQALGWNSGALIGRRSDGVMCTGTWSNGVESSRLPEVNFECGDGSSGTASFYYQDSLTGTAIATGTDTMGRRIDAWSGENVLRFLGNGNVKAAELPCTDRAIPIG